MSRQKLFRGVLILLTYLVSIYPLSLVEAAPPAPATNLQNAFSAAAAEFKVPESILLAVSYNVSRWEDHQGHPSIAGGYGPMHLTQGTQTTPSQRGNAEGGSSGRRPLSNDPIPAYT